MTEESLKSQPLLKVFWQLWVKSHGRVTDAVVQTRSGGWPYFVVNTSWSSWWWPEGWPSFSKILTSWWWTSWWWLRGGFRDFGGVTKCTHSPVKRVKVVVFRGETHPWWWPPPPPPPPRGWIWTSWWWPPTSWFGAKSWWRWPWTEFAPQRSLKSQPLLKAFWHIIWVKSHWRVAEESAINHEKIVKDACAVLDRILLNPLLVQASLVIF